MRVAAEDYIIRYGEWGKINKRGAGKTQEGGGGKSLQMIGDGVIAINCGDDGRS